MARRHSSPLWFSPLSSLLFPRGDALLYLVALLSIFSLLLHRLSLTSVAAHSHFEGFDADDDAIEDDAPQLSDLPLRTPPPIITQSDTGSHHGPPDPTPPQSSDDSSQPSDLPPKPSTTSAFEYWDEDEFEGLPVEQLPETAKFTENATPTDSGSDSKKVENPIGANVSRSYVVEIVCGSFLIMFVINFFTGKRENENIALAWVMKFAVKDSIFEKNFSLLGVGDSKDEDSPLLLKEGQNVFKFFASGRRFCQGLLATMELKSRHDLISRLFNLVVPCKDEISFEVYMNDDAMDHVVFAVAKKKAAKTMQKESRDLQRFASLVSAPSSRKWVAEELAVVSESKEVAGDLVTEAVIEQLVSFGLLINWQCPGIEAIPCKWIRKGGDGKINFFQYHINPKKYRINPKKGQEQGCEVYRIGCLVEDNTAMLSSKGSEQFHSRRDASPKEAVRVYFVFIEKLWVFGDKAFEKYGKGFISMHFSDQHIGMHKKVLVFKFALPDANHMAEMTRLVALVPYYIDLIGRYRMSSQAHSKTEAARQKAAQEEYKELQNARQEALQKKKANRRKLIEEAEAKLSAEAIRKKEAKDRTRQMKKAGPKVKMTRAH
ncbi:hypothetical protein Acr_06g0004970 [Actinidia rufa]|uniref:Coiled-coil domain-containing protein 47 n=1 Tax=Actinidia rufa TaxID=165716 RepID=A0A7J0ESM9_9ERIC|nr:hypothetical protein Acr_06g0004970 [Actinidia rufa]